jgi:hypothetical protein
MKLITTTSLAVIITTALQVAAVAHPTSQIIAQEQAPLAEQDFISTLLDGNWRLLWRIGGIPREAILTIKGNTGKMTVNVKNPNGEALVVNQDMTLQPELNGYILSGSNPKLAESSTANINYSPDKFVIQKASSGALLVKNCSIRTCVPVSITPVQELR